jgi:hypothetical protein
MATGSSAAAAAVAAQPAAISGLVQLLGSSSVAVKEQAASAPQVVLHGSPSMAAAVATVPGGLVQLPQSDSQLFF